MKWRWLIVTRVLGVDLSLTSTGLVALPDTWVGATGLDWSEVYYHALGESLEQDASAEQRQERVETIAFGISDCARAWGVTHVVFEQDTFRQAWQAYQRGELAGVAKLRLRALGLPITVTSSASARKTLLGKVPRKDAKKAVQAHCRQLGVPWADWTAAAGFQDICDAFTVANHRLGELVLGCCVMGVVR